jgi:hypothetical protein
MSEYQIRGELTTLSIADLKLQQWLRARNITPGVPCIVIFDFREPECYGDVQLSREQKLVTP